LLPSTSEEAMATGETELPVTETQDSEPTQSADESELATAKHQESDPAA